ncbi:hypothetical protein F5X98DRAFT_347946 [Xylaria grammica]|nr:hypothetical protein F5X98DRAFT_347946 [Xylaria grammica]
MANTLIRYNKPWLHLHRPRAVLVLLGSVSCTVLVTAIPCRTPSHALPNQRPVASSCQLIKRFCAAMPMQPRTFSFALVGLLRVHILNQ